MYVDDDRFLDVDQLVEPLKTFYKELREGNKPVRQRTRELKEALEVPGMPEKEALNVAGKEVLETPPKEPLEIPEKEALELPVDQSLEVTTKGALEVPEREALMYLKRSLEIIASNMLCMSNLHVPI